MVGNPPVVFRFGSSKARGSEPSAAPVSSPEVGRLYEANSGDCAPQITAQYPVTSTSAAVTATNMDALDAGASMPGAATFASTISVSAASAPATITVSTAAELMAALGAATGGETILLAAGDYGKLFLSNVDFATNVTIRSIKSAEATFSSIDIRGSRNITLDSVTIDYKAASGAPVWIRAFNLVNSNNITIGNSIFDGDLATGTGIGDGRGTGIGLAVTNCTNVSVDGNEFYDWHRGATFGTVSNLTVTSNDVHRVRSDGFDFANVDDVLIESNYFHDFLGAPPGSGDHMDMIQFFTNGTDSPSTNVVIRANILNSAGGDLTQSIFMRNEEVDTGRAGTAMFYRNILIEDNVIYNAHTHGISVGETAGLIVRNNTILHNEDAGSGQLVYVPTIHLANASTRVVVENNIVPRLSLTQTADRIVHNNLIVQDNDPFGYAYVGNLFADALAGAGAALDDLKGVLGGLIEQLGVGSSLTRFGTTPVVPTGFIVNRPETGLEQLTHILMRRTFLDRRVG